MVDWLKDMWNDSVWSKVIATVIVSVAVSFIAFMKLKGAQIMGRREPKLIMTNAKTSPQPQANYKMKYYVDMRNDSTGCVEVRVVEYRPKAITLKSFVHEVLQLRFYTTWFPVPDAADRVAVLPGQLCRAWIGIDETKFTEAQISAAKANMGTLVVSANGTKFSFDL